METLWLRTSPGFAITSQPERTCTKCYTTRLELQAVSLVFDYEDSRGGTFTSPVCQVGKLILTEIRALKKALAERIPDRLKWGRQVVWVLMAYALWLHRNNKLREMSKVLDSAARFLADCLSYNENGFLGTRSRLNFYRGLQKRDQGDFESATEHFQESFRFAQERHAAKIENLRAKPDPTQSRVEETFYRCCLARVQAFGFGEVAFFSGDLAGSLAWFRTVMAGLEDHQGLERWHLSVELYLQGSTVLISQFTAQGMERIQAAQQRLDQLAARLADLHRGYSELARAFSLLGSLRLELMREASRDQAHMALTVNLPEWLLQEVSALRPSRHENERSDETKPVRRHGAISSLISLACAEILLRGGKTEECKEEVEWIRQQFESNVFAQTEGDLLELQVNLVEEKFADALILVERRSHDLQVRANRNQRAFWFALASLASLDPAAKSPLSAGLFAARANSIDTSVRHGFVNHFVYAVVARVTGRNLIVFPMPYQQAPIEFLLEGQSRRRRLPMFSTRSAPSIPKSPAVSSSANC